MNSVRPSVLAFSVLVALSLPAIAEPAQHCVSYGPVVVKLAGTLTSRTYPGPPEYQSIRNGDRPETYWLIALPRPVCVNQDKTAPDIDPAQKNIRRIQLIVSTEEFYERYRRLLGKPVVVTGTLIGGTTIHHNTPVLLWVQTLTKQYPKAK